MSFCLRIRISITSGKAWADLRQAQTHLGVQAGWVSELIETMGQSITNVFFRSNEYIFSLSHIGQRNGGIFLTFL